MLPYATASLARWRAIWLPALYHGQGLTRNFFEGWYFKLVDAAEQNVWAVIPGVFLGAPHTAAQESHAFVQTLNGQTGESHYYRYPLNEFSAARDRFDVRIGPNRFRADHLALDLKEPGQSLRGELQLSGLAPWPVTLLSPGIMGWYAFMPFMECYHGVVSLNHTLAGQLAINGQPVDFSGGRGYTEKDWGQAFPRGWVWMQTNHFADAPGTSFTASVAHIPWLGAAFRGFLAGLWHQGQLYRFATYTGAVITALKLTDTNVRWHVQNRRYTLEIDAQRRGGGLLRAPMRTAMLARVLESLTAEVEVCLTERKSGRVVFAGAGRHAGLEVGGQALPLAASR